MVRLFISQPMRDKTNEEILSEREQAIAYAKDRINDEVEVIDSFFKDIPIDSNPLWFLGKSLELLSTADIIYFTGNWKDFRGCRIEYTAAKEYGISILNDE